MANRPSSKGQNPRPSDLPPEASADLEALGALIGEWRVEGSHVAIPDTVLRGKASFEWLEGNRFLIYRITNEHPDMPDSISIIGADDSGAPLAMHYFDSRGVSRVYQMSTSGRSWKFWREAPGFWQRASGTISDDGKTVTVLIELSSDGSSWQRDLTQTYLRL